MDIYACICMYTLIYRYTRHIVNLLTEELTILRYKFRFSPKEKTHHCTYYNSEYR